MEKFSTVIKNNTDSVVTLKSANNYVYRYFYIQPQSSLTIHFSDEKYFLAPYEKITYKKTGRIDCVRRKGYKAPKPSFPSTVFLNNGPNDTEVIILDSNDTVQLPRGIAIEHQTPLFSFYAEFERVEILPPKQVPVPVVMSPGTIKYESRPNFQYKKRSPAELKKLKKMREDAYLKSAGFGRADG
jgi:hypothetical protein